MNLVVVTDIYGRTQTLETSLRCLSPQYETIRIIDPYDGEQIGFTNEQEAYTFFQESIGLSGYIEKVSHSLTATQVPEYHLLGFSIGGSAVWALSEMAGSWRCSKAICFYSSQIRHFLQVDPGIEMELYFPQSEPHFCVDELIDVLGKKPFVTCFKTPYLHGFMNSKSKNYQAVGCAHYFEIVKNAARRRMV